MIDLVYNKELFLIIYHKYMKECLSASGVFFVNALILITLSNFLLLIGVHFNGPVFFETFIAVYISLLGVSFVFYCICVFLKNKHRKWKTLFIFLAICYGANSTGLVIRESTIKIISKFLHESNDSKVIFFLFLFLYIAASLIGILLYWLKIKNKDDKAWYYIWYFVAFFLAAIKGFDPLNFIIDF